MFEGTRDFASDDRKELSLQSETVRCYRMYKTVIEIMDYRQYIVGDESKNMTLAEFSEQFEHAQARERREIFPPLDMNEDDEVDQSIAVFFNFLGEDITAQYVNRVIKACDKIHKFFLVAPAQAKKGSTYVLDKKAQNFLAELQKKDRTESAPYRFEIFRQDELLFNVLKHDLVPEHRLLSESQKIDLLGRQYL